MAHRRGGSSSKLRCGGFESSTAATTLTIAFAGSAYWFQAPQ
jgi:hypothetical protein